jgi:purine-binding chemotaxis protein CheW
MKRSDDSSDFLLVTRGEANLAIPLPFVHKVIEAQEITPAETGNDIIAGVINYHGRVIPVLSLDKKFSMETKEISPEERFVLIRQNDSTYAIITDNKVEVIKIDNKHLQQDKGLFPGISGIHAFDHEDRKIIQILDPDTFFTSKEMADIQTILIH